MNRRSNMNRLDRLTANGVSIWLDTLSRDLLESGEFERLRRDRAVTGATSNPTIFAKAICRSDSYDGQLQALLDAGTTDPRELFLALAVEDVRRAAKELEGVHRETQGHDGFVSLEVTPDLAHDSTPTVAQATKLWRRLDASNVMIKVPATEAGVIAIEELTAAGVNVNVTLLFAVERYGEVIAAYLRGLERRVRAGEPLAGIRSVASFFVSRVDAKADARLASDSPLLGRVGVANAVVAYESYRAALESERWRRLEALGAAPQRPLWASTAPKDPDYRDVLYLEQLALPDSILTVPEPTLQAFADHGVPNGGPTDFGAARHALRAATAGIDLGAVTAELESEGVEAFCEAYVDLLECIERRSGIVQRGGGAAAAVLG
jgi:transaldolase